MQYVQELNPKSRDKAYIKEKNRTTRKAIQTQPEAGAYRRRA